MDRNTKQKLEAAGWVFGDADQFLGLTDAESAFIHMRFAIASTCFVTLVIWGITAWIVEPKFGRSNAGADRETDDVSGPTRREVIGVGLSSLLFFGLIILVVMLIQSPGSFLYGEEPGGGFDRWIALTVPLMFFVFGIPGLLYGIVIGKIRSSTELVDLLNQTMSDMAPILVLGFTASQFVAIFNHSRLGEMLAIAGGNLLASSSMPNWLLLLSFIVLVAATDFIMGSMSQKYALFAPVFVPMFMIGADITPELTQAAYRIGDSVANVSTPFNPYLPVILVYLRRYMPEAGLGTLMALMLPYTIVTLLCWSGLLLLWVEMGWPLGPGGEL